MDQRRWICRQCDDSEPDLISDAATLVGVLIRWLIFFLTQGWGN
jgi:hypothetical protein